MRTDIRVPDVEQVHGPEMQILDYDIVWAAKEREAILAKWEELQKE